MSSGQPSIRDILATAMLPEALELMVGWVQTDQQCGPEAAEMIRDEMHDANDALFLTAWFEYAYSLADERMAYMLAARGVQ